MASWLGAPPIVFLILTVGLAGGAVVLAGRAVARNWKPAWQVVGAAFGLACFNRFLVFALFGGGLLNLWGFLVAFALLVALGLATWSMARAATYVRQYPWRYERASPFAFREKTSS